MSDLTPPGIPPIPEAPLDPPPAAQLIPPPPGTGELVPTANDKTMGMLCHLLALSGFVGIPLGNIAGPLVVWLTQKDKSGFADYHGKESLNFQITILIAGLISAVLCIILIGFLMLFALWVYGIAMTIIAAMKASEGVRYRYPYILRFIK